MNEKREINYYIVKAKCGHVGKGKYIPIDFPIRSRDAKRAAFIIRQKPGVKHHHSDAILSVRKVSYVEFILYRKIFKDDLYWQRARRNFAALVYRVKEEGFFFHIDKPSKNNREPKINKRASRSFRVRKFCCIERSIARDVIDEYGMIV